MGFLLIQYALAYVMEWLRLQPTLIISFFFSGVQLTKPLGIKLTTLTLTKEGIDIPEIQLKGTCPPIESHINGNLPTTHSKLGRDPLMS